MTDLGLQGWSPDPFGLHESRYFSGGRPTKLVRDGGRDSYDEPPSDSFTPVRTAVAEPPEFFPVPGPVPVPSAALPPRRVRVGPFIGALLLVAGTVAGLIAKNAGSHSPAMSPAALVTQSAQRTLAEDTAYMTMSGTVGAQGTSVALSASGQLDFTADAFEFEAQYQVPGHSFGLREILVNRNIYVATSANGRPVRMAGGREWLHTTVPGTQSVQSDNSDPRAWLAELEKHASSVQVLGTKIIGGVTCTGYAVTPAAQAGAGSAVVTIWIDSQHLVREMNMSMRFGSANSTLAGNVVIDLSGFGAPVHITAPPASDTASIASIP